jgi:Tol biopolymer transport system component
MQKRSLVALASLALASLLAVPASTQSPPEAAVFAEPGISPDGREIAFASGGDLWTVPAAGGDARLLVSHPATEARPLFSPTGDALAFTSTRTGGGDIYILRFGDPTPVRLTFDDGAELLDGWSRDGRWIYYSATARDIAGMNDVFRVSVGGGTPMPVTNERYTSEFFSAPGPDPATVAFSARGNAAGQWWRNGHSHLDESEIWTRVGTTYRRIVGRGAKSIWPMWASDGRGLYFMSDRSGSENIWHTSLDGQPRQVTQFARGRVLWPTIAADGRTIAFERDFGVWTLDTASGRAAAVPIRLRGANATASQEHLRFTNQFTELALSPDGKKAVIAVRGDLFAVSAKDGGEAERVTDTPGPESHVSWTADSRRIVYTAQRAGAFVLAHYDLGSRTETVLASGAEEYASPLVSPDGKAVAYVHGQRKVAVVGVDGSAPRVLATGEFASGFEGGQELTWSPDSKWVAYMNRGPRGFTNVEVVQAEPGTTPTPRAVSFLANAGAGSPAWSPDGTFITFATGQRTEDGQVARIDLLLRTPKFREDRFRSLFDQETPAPRTPAPLAPAAPLAPSTPAPGTPALGTPALGTPALGTPALGTPALGTPALGTPALGTPAPAPPAPSTPAPVFDEIRRRLTLLPVGLDVRDQTISPDGKWLLLSAAVAGQSSLYLYSLDDLATEPPVARQLTTTPGAKTSAQFSPDSKEIYYLDAGRVQVATVDDRRVRGLDVSVEMDVSFAREKMAVFEQAWSLLRDNFFDAKYNGVDWAAARTAYGTRIAGTRTPDEMRRVTALMIGELNASHLGISAPPGGTTPVVGKLGVRFDPEEYGTTGRLRIAEIIPLGPMAVASGAQVGDVVAAVNGRTIDRATNIDDVLQHTIGRRVTLTLVGADGANRRDVAVRPVNLATEKGLLYRSWVEAQRARVDALSNGRLGYAHMPDMSAQSLEQLHLDLDAENHRREGVVIDVRNNNGGFVNVYAIDVLARRSFFDMTLRGSAVRAPSRSVLGQRALERPTILLTNQHSLSDAEDFTEGYRSLRLGKVVGEPTAGWIIYTWNTPLVDGSILRLPRIRITATDGTDMEMRPRPVDITVSRALGEDAQGRDTQIEAAVKELLGQVGRSTSQP